MRQGLANFGGNWTRARRYLESKLDWHHATDFCMDDIVDVLVDQSDCKRRIKDIVDSFLTSHGENPDNFYRKGGS